MLPHPVRVTRVIPAPASAIFDLLADPGRHHDIDGSGTVTTSRGGHRRLKLGDSFGMDMHWGVNYSTRNDVVVFEEDRAIAWRTLAPMPLRLVLTGRTWRYDLRPVEGGTEVTETWDPTTEAFPSRLALGRLADLTRRNMTRTLARIEEIVTQENGTEESVTRGE
ncbi:MAG: SRPBCC family protein [Tetrasphaera sp.]|jgi:hypothetical protein|nr:SRPBCC family protein [Tetrasphaera sp.]